MGAAGAVGSWSELEDVARGRRFARHDVLCHDGDTTSGVHIIRRGRVAVRLGTSGGELVTVEVLGPGEVVGELAHLEGFGTRAASVVALETVETWSLPADAFAELRRRLPAVDEQLMVTLARRLRQMNGRLLEALFVPATDRVLCRLVEAAADYSGGKGPIDVPLAQRDLAELAGTTPETVNRVLRREEARGTVQLGRRRIRVVDIETLTRDVKQSSNHREASGDR